MTASTLTDWRRSPTLVRALPFLLFVALTACQGVLGEASRYWIYLLKTLAGAGMIWAIYPKVLEMRWAFSWEAVAVGVGVFGLWVGLDGFYPPLEVTLKKVLCPLLRHVGLEAWCAALPVPPRPWNPHLEFGPGGIL